MYGVVVLKARWILSAAAVIALLPISAGALEVTAESIAEIPETSAYAYSLYCANNGEYIVGKRDSERLPMASTTKIMTALLGLESNARGEVTQVTITEDMYAEGSSMYLAAGETVPMREMMGAMLMVSGNDAANAAAIAIGGSMEGFARIMNERAAQIGLADTHFVTPSGLDAEGHFTTARDLAKLMAYCMENDDFAQLDGSSAVTVDFIEPRGKSETYYNENKLLSRYEYCIAGKTGFTDLAGRTLVSCAEKDGVRLICVTLNDGDDWNDHEKLYEYGFSEESLSQPERHNGRYSVPVVGGSAAEVYAEAGEPPFVCVGQESGVTFEIDLPRFVYAPIEKGEVVGAVKYYTGGIYAGKAELTAVESVSVDDTQTGYLENLWSYIRKLVKRFGGKKDGG